MSKFEIGKLVTTRLVADKMVKEASFKSFVEGAFRKYVECNWGDTGNGDAKMNDQAVLNGDDRILAVYKMPDTKITIWIITEWDRSVTTILFPEEY